jgi:hypothetical protein
MTKATSLKQRLEREVAKREQFQEQANILEEKLVFEKQRLAEEHSIEVQSLKRKWLEEKSILLNVIQRDCNVVFEQNRKKSHASPKSVVHDFAAFEQQLNSSEEMESTGNGGDEKTSNVYSGASLRYSGIDQELRETEVLVQNLLGSRTEDL